MCSNLKVFLFSKLAMKLAIYLYNMHYIIDKYLTNCNYYLTIYSSEYQTVGITTV